MRILFLSHLIPWPAPLMGGQLRVARLVQALARYCDVTLVCSGSPYESPAKKHWFDDSALESMSTVPLEDQESSSDPLWGDGRTMLRALLPTSVPSLISARVSKSLADHLAQIPGTFSAIWASRSWTAEAARLARKEKVLVDIDDFESILLGQDMTRLGRYRRRLLHHLQVRRLAEYEASLPARFAGVAITKAEDFDLLDARHRGRSFLVPNGVDLPTVVRRAPIAGRLLFVGSFAHPPNLEGMLWFCNEVLPIIRRFREDVTIDIVGKGPAPREWDRVRTNPGVTFIESPMELTEYYSRATAVLAPIRIGHGTKLKTLEALAYRIPLVATTEAAAGLSLTPNKHYLLADEPEQFAAQCLMALDERADHSGMVRLASTIAEDFSWTQCGQRAMSALQQVAA